MKLELSQKLQDALNKQVQLEYEATYVYRGMTLYFEAIGAPGAKRWMAAQTMEETEHAQDFIDMILELDGQVELGAIPAQPTQYDSVLDVFRTGLEHEKKISASILEILELAIEEKNYAVENFLRTYVDEQVEEEDHFRGVVEMLEMAGNDPAALFKVDSILGKRGA